LLDLHADCSIPPLRDQPAAKPGSSVHSRAIGVPADDVLRDVAAQFVFAIPKTCICKAIVGDRF
jgi:hypothetical protein